ncbi:MAG: Nif3-like dinuclear metal center hexameric protein [Clostridia bacterium]|nr:Nif3-like dinuclear metal center hexameric protein [Clostridia bacterium]
MKAYEVAEIIEKTAPRKLAMKWDNVGFMIGDPNREVKRILTALDVTSQTAEQAVSMGCDMILSHHPMFFDGIKAIDFSTPEGDTVRRLVSENIAVYACHTNMDCAAGGINDYLADLFELSEVSVLEENPDFPGTGIGRLGTLPESMDIKTLCSIVKSRLNTPFVRVISGTQKSIKRVAVASGSCAEYIPLALKKGADAIVTADMKYHDSLTASEYDIYVIDAGHYPTEFVVTDIFEKLLRDTGIELCRSNADDVFKLF